MVNMDGTGNIAKIEYFDEEIPMVDITVDDCHCYYLNGILTHNCAEELYVAASLSGEKVWIEAIQNGLDMHKSTASRVFHVSYEDVNGNQRKRAKCANFGLLYDGNEYTLHTKLGLPMDEALEMYNNYRTALPTLYRWKESLYKEGRINGEVKDFLGFRRRLYYYYHTGNRKLSAFADRTAVNQNVQGLCGNFMRIVLSKLEKLIYEPDGKWYNSGVCFFNTVHDEVVFIAPKEKALEFLWDQKEIMEGVTPPSFPVRLKASPEIGYNYGELMEGEIERLGDESSGYRYVFHPTEEEHPHADAPQEQVQEEELPEMEEEEEESLAGFEF